MKLLVNFIQILIIGVIVYPIYYVWETQHIDNFCREITPGMSDKKLIELVKEYHVTLIGLDENEAEKGKWLAQVKAKSSFSDYRCEIGGIANKVAHASIMEEK
ncbi:hypothetical protein GCM10007891_12190 [Methylophaga thalassica]|jgi:hypothetical protein|uniref:Uncharacterized protein n=1 Tax=Methylophaga thalassica TaxID=40223 RepID=A0ABQ5TWZ5_9GAMM|nr:hypothetical protein [Methylophaga thalassica]GLP99365.1 hypothetical protein GCM10007891_12190 [Methylophaga thalassica]